MDLEDPATTVALLQLDAVIGVKGVFEGDQLQSVAEGGFYHDGRFPTLQDVLDHYDAHLGLALSDAEKDDLEQYLLSLGGSDRTEPAPSEGP